MCLPFSSSLVTLAEGHRIHGRTNCLVLLDLSNWKWKMKNNSSDYKRYFGIYTSFYFFQPPFMLIRGFLVFSWKSISTYIPSHIVICGVIKQNQSEVGQIQFSFFKVTVCTIFTATFYREPHWNWSIDSKDMSSWRMPKTIGNKRHFLLCLALSENQYFWLTTDFAWSRHMWV